MIVYTSIAVKLVQTLAGKWLFRRTHAWRAGAAA